MGQSGIDLVESGIQTELSDIRCHVAPQTESIFVFETAPVLKIVQDGLASKRYQFVSGYQKEVRGETARGVLLPIADVPDLRHLQWEESWERLIPRLWHQTFYGDLTTSEKGSLAEKIAIRLMLLGRFPVWFRPVKVTDRSLQLKGVDLIIQLKKHVQVKCDFDAGPENLCGTGNLFIQFSERNPLGRH